MCDKTIKAKDLQIARLEAALFEALKKNDAPVKDLSKSRTVVHSQRISVESNKENLMGLSNNQPQNLKLEDFLRKKSPSNPVTNKNQPKPVKPEQNKASSSARVLMPSHIEFNNKLVTTTMNQRPATSAGYPKESSEGAKGSYKTQAVCAENLSEMFRKKKNASSVLAGDKKAICRLSNQLTIATPKFDFPLPLEKKESPNNIDRQPSARSIEKKSEIEHILLDLLEEHKETNSESHNLLNKLNFIDRAIKR